MLDNAYHCGLCNLSCSGFLPYKAHIESTKHKRRLQLQVDEMTSGPYLCHVCNTTMSGPEARRDHDLGAKHLRNVAVRASREITEPENRCNSALANHEVQQPSTVPASVDNSIFSPALGSIVPVLTAVNASTEPVAAVDQTSAENQLQIKDDSEIVVLQSGPIDQYYCKACKTGISGLSNNVFHEKGRKHANALAAYKHKSAEKETRGDAKEEGAEKTEKVVISEKPSDEKPVTRVDAEEGKIGEKNGDRSGNVAPASPAAATFELISTLEEDAKKPDSGTSTQDLKSDDEFISTLININDVNAQQYFCNVCNVPISGSVGKESHKSGKKHIKTLAAHQHLLKTKDAAENAPVNQEMVIAAGVHSVAKTSEVISSKTISNGILTDVDGKIVVLQSGTTDQYYCRACNTKISGPSNKETHEGGRRHKNAVAKLLTTEEPPAADDPQPDHDAAAISAQNPSAGNKGSEIGTNVDESNKKRNIFGSHFCDLCQVYLSGDENKKLHDNGSRHLKMLAKTRVTGNNNLEKESMTANASASGNSRNKRSANNPKPAVMPVSAVVAVATAAARKNSPGCKVCGITGFSEEEFAIRHFATTNHIRNLQLSTLIGSADQSYATSTAVPPCGAGAVAGKNGKTAIADSESMGDVWKWLSELQPVVDDNPSMMSSSISIIDPKEVAEENELDNDLEIIGDAD